VIDASILEQVEGDVEIKWKQKEKGGLSASTVLLPRNVHYKKKRKKNGEVNKKVKRHGAREAR